jgi:hypothetical protein
MSRNKKPRKAYRPRPIAVNTLDLALHRAAKPAVADRDEILGVLRKAIQALREGVALEHQWSIAAGAVTVALAIERQGIVRGLQEHFKSAEQHLQDIYDRAMKTGGGRWTRVTLYYQELDALQLLYELHEYQLDQLGRAEFLAAIDAAKKDTIAAGFAPVVVHDVERMAA